MAHKKEILKQTRVIAKADQHLPGFLSGIITILRR